MRWPLLGGAAISALCGRLDHLHPTPLGGPHARAGALGVLRNAMVRQSNFSHAATNKAAITITPQIYDRRGMSSLPVAADPPPDAAFAAADSSH